MQGESKMNDLSVSTKKPKRLRFLKLKFFESTISKNSRNVTDGFIFTGITLIHQIINFLLQFMWRDLFSQTEG